MVSDLWLHGFLSDRRSAQSGVWEGEHRAITTHLLPACPGGSWQRVLSGRFQDALVLSHASAGIHHLIKEGCGHPAVALRWPQCHAAAWTISWRGINKRCPQNGSRACHDDRERFSVEKRGKICAVKKSPSWMLHWILRLPEAHLRVPVAVPA